MENPQIEKSQVGNESLLAKGADIALVKRATDPFSEAPVGTILYGNSEGIGLGLPARFRNGHTTSVAGIDIDKTTGKILVRTGTSTYELLDKSFKGLALNMGDLGSVGLP